MKAEYRQRFYLAYNSRGLNISLDDLPDFVVKWFIMWHNEATKDAEEQMKKKR